MTEEELQRALDAALPASHRHDVFVEECNGQDVRLRFSPPQGEGWSDGRLLMLADIALRAAAGLSARLTHFNATAIRPAQAADVLALARVIRRDGRSIHAEAWLFSHAVVEPMLHATATVVVD